MARRPPAALGLDSLIRGRYAGDRSVRALLGDSLEGDDAALESLLLLLDRDRDFSPEALEIRLDAIHLGVLKLPAGRAFSDPWDDSRRDSPPVPLDRQGRDSPASDS